MVIKFIDCTEKYHDDMNQVVSFLENYLNAQNITNYRLKLSDMRIVKCTECRCCTQKKGEEPVKCINDDDMNEVIDAMEEADGYIILSDRNNLFSRNSIHEKFSQRLVAYHYWPYGQTLASPRRISLQKKSILINYNTTNMFMHHSFYVTRIYMEQSSTSIGATPLDWEAITPKENLVKSYATRLQQMTDTLIDALSQGKKEA